MLKYANIITTHTTISTAINEGTLVSVTSSILKLVGHVDSVGDTLICLSIDGHMVVITGLSTNIAVGQDLS